MAEATMATSGQKQLEILIEQVQAAERDRVTDPAALAIELWPTFKAAVAAAAAELRGEELEGVRRWQDARKQG